MNQTATLIEPVAEVVETTADERVSFHAEIAQGFLEEARSFEITDDLALEFIHGRMKIVKKALKDVEAERKSWTEPLEKQKKRLIANFRPVENILKETIRVIGGEKILPYTEERDRIAAEEQARIEAEERKEREALEKKRLAAEERERKAREAAQAVEDEKERKRLLAKAEKDREKAEAFAERAETVPVTIAPAPVKAPEGMSISTRYSAKVVDIVELCRAVAADPSLAHFVKADGPALNRKAKADREAFNVPGVRLVKDRGVSTRS